MPRWIIAAFTHGGRVRASNEDAVALHTRVLTGDMTEPLVVSHEADRCVLMIADGMGGHAHGAMASRAVLDHLVGAIDQLADPASCREAIEAANQHLYTLMQQHAEARGMGSTLVGAILNGERLITFNVGDSRCYLFSAGRLVQLSQDDVPESDSDHFGHRSHALTQALGGSSFPVAVIPHIATDAPLASGEMLLLCSDGLTDMVNDPSISKILHTCGTPLQSVRRLVAKAFSAGGRDNISLIAICRSEPSAQRDG